ncbi:hypothetical protein BC829DRAFT_414159 [Chytridium lagenaria]|nr:hypothetical protein BC829DRAFT_414159 [Chytridium lagenaria]
MSPEMWFRIAEKEGVSNEVKCPASYALVTMCGIEEGERILSENWGWRTWVGLPLIPIGLISSRLRRAGSLLPLMPFVILGGDQIRLTLPPSPAMTICLLPWARQHFGYFSFIRTRIPDVFHQNVLGGFAFVLMKDIARYVYKHRKKANRRTRTIKNYIPE